jgi:hypothetical protein
MPNTQVQLWLPFNKYRLALSIPFDECQRFSFHPLAWLRYVAYTIYGREGHLSMSANGPMVDCHAAIMQPTKYYYVSQGESYFVF